MSVTMQDFVLDHLFFEMNMDWNEGGTRTLVLRGNDLYKRVGRRVNNEDVVKMVQFLKKHPEVISLELPHNEIDDCGVYNLMKHVKKQSTVKYVNLINNNITGRGVRYIVELGKDLPFYVLRLSCNKIGNEGAIALSKLLYLDVPLKLLDISDCNITMSGLAHVLTGLMCNYGGVNKLEVIDIGRPLQQFYHQMCDAHAAEFFGQVLHYNTSLKEFHVQQYQLDFRDMEIMLDGLMPNRTLQLLDLNNNNIGDDGVDYICRYLRTGPPLRALMLGVNNFGDKGAAGLGSNLPYSHVVLLDVSHNRITDTGLLDILHTFKKRDPLRALFIWGNKLTHRSLALLNTILSEGVLDYDHCDVTPYYDREGYKAAENSSANKYRHRFYCVSNYGHPPLRRVTKYPGEPEVPPKINFLYHVDDSELGVPLYGE